MTITIFSLFFLNKNFSFFPTSDIFFPQIIFLFFFSHVSTCSHSSSPTIVELVLGFDTYCTSPLPPLLLR